jgi:hypothetical protein
MASILNVDQINNAAGTSGLTLDASTGKASFPNGATLPAGSVVQVQTASRLGTSSISTSTNNSYLYTNDSVSITPLFANSKIIIQVHGGNLFCNSSDTRGYATIYRSVSGQSDVDLSNAAQMGLVNSYTGSSNRMSSVACGAVDSSLVNNTTPHIYKLYIAMNGSGTTYFDYDKNNIYMTAMEIAQ